MLQPVTRPLLESPAEIWPRLKKEALAMQTKEPSLARYAGAIIVSAPDFGSALANLLAEKLSGAELDATQLRALFAEFRKSTDSLDVSASRDLSATVTRDP